MQVEIKKWGNSLAIRIPKSFANQIEINQGSIIDLFTKDGKLIIKPIKKNKEYSLDVLLEGVSEKNIHKEIGYGEPMGDEIW